MKATVAGAGAIGARVGAALQRAGDDVPLIRRGPHPAALGQHGVRGHVQDNDLVQVTSPHDNQVTHGTLCIKGRFGFHHVQNRD
ncbi:2-dehydropantoate 2-reductase N-terminal domain-containing protein [Streptomyces sp. NPDC001970]